MKKRVIVKDVGSGIENTLVTFLFHWIPKLLKKSMALRVDDPYFLRLIKHFYLAAKHNS